jgi:hypothetical protein
MAETPKLPPPSFSFLVATLGGQASMSLGQLPNPLSGKSEVNLELAKHFIDTLAILEEKTEGNLTPDETAMLEGALHQLRLGYLEAQKSRRDT